MWNVLAIVVALIAGSIVNMLLVTVGPMLIPPPAGVDVADMASLAASIHLFEARHFVFPFLAHALGTLTGAMIAVMMSHRAWSAWLVGLLFLVGGIAVGFMIPSRPCYPNEALKERPSGSPHWISFRLSSHGLAGIIPCRKFVNT